MLADTERAKGQLKHVVPTWHHEDTPTLSELGLTKNESARAQFLSSMPRETFDEIKSGQKTIMSALKKGPAVVIKCYGSGLPTRAGAANRPGCACVRGSMGFSGGRFSGRMADKLNFDTFDPYLGHGGR